MDLESYSADQMPEDAWEQRNEFSDRLYNILKDMKETQVGEDITLNSLLIATLSYLYTDSKNDNMFIKFVDYYTKSLNQAAEGWIEKDDS